MILYHASPYIIERPDVSYSRDFLDFGKGFYLTAIREQAEKYAMRFLRRGQKAYINEYVLDEDLSEYNVMTFDRYDEAWLEYVGACRKGNGGVIYDIVSGGIADDKVFNTIDLYFAGEMSKEDALGRLAFEYPNHQICILNQNVILHHLKFKKATEITIEASKNDSK
ncbi:MULTISPECIES: DUF3990 domain-containing protein [Bacteroides]|jgi:hypothetical protein|uniref:Sortase n=1 Tax=Bacteroides clarus TaxID=626929 RepID=A0A1Y3YHU2_9BACE|nr:MULTISPECIES: DUF3990 domain-containing protein [Bacteroides]OKY99313.1 MAG: sortase [Bacteroides sp. 44_46]OUN97393.1 sortase [Bacteroides clarus]